MSEPLSTNEIEDVVSSVRRLVSPEARPRPMSRDLGLDRLILTPQLRIVAEQPISGPTIVKLETVTKKSRAKAKKPNAPVDHAFSDTALADPKPEALVKPGPSLSEMVLSAEEATVIPVSPVMDIEPEPRVEKKGRSAKRAAAEPAELQAEPALPESAVILPETSPAARRRSRKSGTDAKATQPEQPMPESIEAVIPAPETAERKRRGKAKATAEPTPPVVVTATASKAPGAKVARGRKALAKTELAEAVVAAAVPDASGSAVAAELPSLDPTGSDLDRLLAEPLPTAAHGGLADETPLVEASVDGDDLATKPEAPVMASTPLLADPDGNAISLLDEEALILLLRRLVREELQGALGEKITRNVRKLVRAEINRALTAQTLD